MGNLKKTKVWIVGSGMIIDAGHMSEKEFYEFSNMSPDAKKIFIEKYIANFPKAYINTAGFCTFKKRHVSERDCVACARIQGMIKIAEFNLCRQQNLSRPEEDFYVKQEKNK